MNLSEPVLRRMSDALPMDLAYVDRDGHCRFVNRMACERLGLPAGALTGQLVAELACMPGGARMQGHVELALAGHAQVFEFEEGVGDEQRIFECRLLPDLDDSGRPAGFFLTRLDITERVQAARSVARERATLSSVTEAVPEMIMVLDRELRYRFVNGAFERWCDTARSRVVGRSMAQVLGDEHYLRLRAGAQRALAGETVHVELHHAGRGPAAHVCFTFIPQRVDDGRVDGIVGVGRDVTAHRLENARLAHQAHRDPLTGLLNRAGFDDRLNRMLQSRESVPLALLCIDLDGFKAVNDTHGHPAGDQLLQLVADRLQHLVRPADAVARLGGDEFAIVLGGMRRRAHALGVADKIIAAVGAPFDLSGVDVRIGASVGVAWGGGDVRDLAARADAALYGAKRAGKGRVECAPDRPTRSLVERDALGGG